MFFSGGFTIAGNVPWLYEVGVYIAPNHSIRTEAKYIKFPSNFA